MLKAFRKINLTGLELSKFQDNVSTYLDQVQSVELLDGLLIEGLEVSTAALAVPHGLGRVPVGYFIVKSSANVTIYDTTSVTPKSTLMVTASGSATINLWIF